MKILIVSSYLPFPLFSGGHIRLFNLIKGLSKRHEISLVCEIRDYQTKQDIEEVKKFCKEVIVVPRRKQWSFRNMLHTGLSPYPFLMVGHTSWEMRSRISEQLNKVKYDLIHVETFYVMQNIPKIEIPIVLAEHNVEYLVYRRFANRILLPFRPFLYIDVLKMKYWEESYWNKVNKLIAVSEDEKKMMKRKDVTVIPNGVDLEKFKFSQREKIGERILFIGDFRWLANKDTLLWILKKIWPDFLRAQTKGSFILWVVGRNIPQSLRKITDHPSVVFEDGSEIQTEKIFKNSSVLLAPIRVGGGTSFKILEAMACGVPVVTNELGIEGIKAENLKQVLIGETKSEIISCLNSLIEDAKLYSSIAKNARKLVGDKYSWKEIVEKLELVYYQTLRN